MLFDLPIDMINETLIYLRKGEMRNVIITWIILNGQVKNTTRKIFQDQELKELAFKRITEIYDYKKCYTSARRNGLSEINKFLTEFLGKDLRNDDLYIDFVLYYPLDSDYILDRVYIEYAAESKIDDLVFEHITRYYPDLISIMFEDGKFRGDKKLIRDVNTAQLLGKKNMIDQSNFIVLYNNYSDKEKYKFYKRLMMVVEKRKLSHAITLSEIFNKLYGGLPDGPPSIPKEKKKREPKPPREKKPPKERKLPKEPKPPKERRRGH